ncbi:F-box/LRR-repeat protein 6 [Onthophagus taurus]|uniref:F-box/LRR-repeat protein 6 n=1 Tax=Onthophagus taurus TaxID=166361 RepID=UPI000C203E95|nr:F-box/LRR-repeat protein 6 [Onthophagus taurus]
MAGKMLEPDSNTREIHLSSITDPIQNKTYLESVSCFDSNGGVKYNDCDMLPNNNVCHKVPVSQCYSDSECSKNDGMSSGKDSYTPSGESGASDVPMLESDTHSLQTSDSQDGISPDEAKVHESPDSQSSKVELDSATASYVPDESTFNSVLNASNGVIKKSTDKQRKRVVRGRPRKGVISTYESQISGDKNTIIIRIKKNLTAQVLARNKKKSGRRKKRNQSDTDTSDYESSMKKPKTSMDFLNATPAEEPLEQSVWGDQIPEPILHKIFYHASLQEGSLPLLVRLCRVCKLWRQVALSTSLWQKVDLNWVSERYRTDQKLNWLIDNRLIHCQDLNLGIWKVRNIQTALEYIVQNCTELRGLNLSGWKGLNADNLKYITTECENLERLDLSSVNSASAINAQPLVSLAQSMSSRLTHLVLAHNKIAGFAQIMSALAANCPNLQLLDISNIRTFAHNTALLHVEKLQSGCPKLRVLRMTNSQIWLAPASLSDQVASPGFPMLEELSLAGIEDDHKMTTARSMDDDGIERILKNSTKLRLLDIRGCIKLTDSGLVKVPAWDLEHLFLSACYITRTHNSGMELIVQKWGHSLLEVDLAWSTATKSLDAAVQALADRGAESPLRSLNLCGSSVSLEPVKAVLTKCQKLQSINLQSCRALPRGIKRLYTGDAVKELRESLMDKPKTEEAEDLQVSPEYSAQ